MYQKSKNTIQKSGLYNFNRCTQPHSEILVILLSPISVISCTGLSNRGGRYGRDGDAHRVHGAGNDRPVVGSPRGRSWIASAGRSPSRGRRVDRLRRRRRCRRLPCRRGRQTPGRRRAQGRRGEDGDGVRFTFVPISTIGPRRGEAGVEQGGGRIINPPLRGNVVVNITAEARMGIWGGDAPRQRGAFAARSPGRSEGPGSRAASSHPAPGPFAAASRPCGALAERRALDVRGGHPAKGNFDSDNVDDEDGTAFRLRGHARPATRECRDRWSAARPRTRRDARHIVVSGGENRRNCIERAREGATSACSSEGEGGVGGGVRIYDVLRDDCGILPPPRRWVAPAEANGDVGIVVAIAIITTPGWVGGGRGRREEDSVTRARVTPSCSRAHAWSSTSIAPTSTGGRKNRRRRRGWRAPRRPRWRMRWTRLATRLATKRYTVHAPTVLLVVIAAGAVELGRGHPTTRRTPPEYGAWDRCQSTCRPAPPALSRR
jgi:hypothetical protein